MTISTESLIDKNIIDDSERKNQVHRFNRCTDLIQSLSLIIIQGKFGQLPDSYQTTISGISYPSLDICKIQIKGSDEERQIRLLKNGKLAIGLPIFQTRIWSAIFMGRVVDASELDNLTISPESYKAIERELIHIASSCDVEDNRYKV